MLSFSKSHNMILFRKTVGITQSTWENLDIIFHRVYFVDIPLKITDVSIFEATNAEIDQINKRCYFPVSKDFRTVFKLKGADDKTHFVGASHYSLNKNTLGLDETSYHLFPDFSWGD